MTRCARPQAKKDSLFPQELLKTPSWQQKGPQISIIDYVKNWNRRQSAIEAHQQDKARRTEPHQQAKVRKARGTRAKPLTLDTTHKLPPPPHTHTHTVRKGLSPGQKGPTVPTGAINNPLSTAKAATNGNHKLKLTRRINPGRQAAPACGALHLTQPTIPPSPAPPHSLERTEDCFNKHDCNFDNDSKIG